MKTKLNIVLMSLLCLSLISSCRKKEEEEPQNETLSSETKQFNDDSNRYKSESSDTDDDINKQLQGLTGFDNTGAITGALCGTTIDTSQLSQKIVYFNFDGVTPCASPSRTRSGQIKVQLTAGNLWSEANAVLTITYINFKVTRLYDQKFIVFNGVKTLKNINGNHWLNFYLGNQIHKYQERALNIQVEFNDNKHATWNSARMAEWSFTPSVTRYNFTSNGDTTVNGYSNVDSWGTNRFGNSFTTYYTSAIHSNSVCWLWRFTSGELVHTVNGKNFILTLGVNEQGNPSTLACAYGYKITWTGINGDTQSIVLSY